MTVTLFTVFFILLVIGTPIVFAIGAGTALSLLVGGMPRDYKAVLAARAKGEA